MAAEDFLQSHPFASKKDSSPGGPPSRQFKTLLLGLLARRLQVQRRSSASCANPEFIRLSDDGIVRHDDPLAVKAHTISAVLCIPINILNAEPIRERTAHALPTSELIEPCMQGVVGIAAVVAREGRTTEANQ